MARRDAAHGASRAPALLLCRNVRELGRILWRLLVETYTDWSTDRAPRLAAALAFYTTLSLAPLLLVVISVAGLLFGREAVQGEVLNQLRGVTGPDGAQAIQDMLAAASQPAESALASVIGLLTLAFGAAGVVWQLKDALNTIWEVPDDPAQSWGAMLRERLVSFALVLGVGFVLLASLVISTAMATISGYLHSAVLPGSDAIWMVLNFVLSFAVVALLFALIFKFVPDVTVRWSDVWIGALGTAVLFEIGKHLLSFYLGRAGVSSAYGAAGSLAVLLVWIYYAAQILFFGAEFTQVYARRFGSRIQPAAARRRGAPEPAARGQRVPA